MRSSSVGSAHWMSSRTTISGCPPASVSRKLTDRPEDLLRRRAAPTEADRRRDPVRDEVGVGLRGEKRMQSGERVGGSQCLVDAGGPTDHRRDRPVRDPLAVRQASPGQGVRLGRGGDELLHEPRLPDPGRPEHGDQTARTLGDGLVVRASQLLELMLATDQRCVELALERRLRDQPVQPPSVNCGCLPLEIERPRRLDLDRATNECASRLRDQDLARLRGLLESSRDVDGVAAREHAARANRDFTRVDPGPDHEPDAVRGLQLVVHPLELEREVEGRAHRAECVVLVNVTGRRRSPSARRP